MRSVVRIVGYLVGHSYGVVRQYSCLSKVSMQLKGEVAFFEEASVYSFMS